MWNRGGTRTAARGLWRSRTALVALLLIVLAGPRVRAQAALARASIDEHLGAAIPAGLTFTDSDGQRIALGSLLGGTPLVISLAYFTCPMLCPLTQDGAADAFRASGWRLGRDFRAITVSVDPHDTLETATEWRARAAARLGVPPSDMDWHFVTGDEASITQLANAVGYRYAYDPSTKQYSHAAALFIVGADGRLSRYLYGINFEPQEMGAALDAARANRREASTESFLMRCFHYVPALRRHGGFVVWLLRIGGLTVTSAIASVLFVLWRREARA